MKILYVYFSRTGNNAILAKDISNRIDCNLERIETKEDLSKISSVFFLGINSLFGIRAKIRQPKEDPSDYDLVIIGTPAWAGSLPSPAWAYLEMLKEKIKKYAIASLSGKGDNPKALEQIRKILGKEPVAVLELSMPETDKPSMDQKIDKEYLKKECTGKITEFLEKIRKAS